MTDRWAVGVLVGLALAILVPPVAVLVGLFALATGRDRRAETPMAGVYWLTAWTAYGALALFAIGFTVSLAIIAPRLFGQLLALCGLAALFGLLARGIDRWRVA